MKLNWITGFFIASMMTLVIGSSWSTGTPHVKYELIPYPSGNNITTLGHGQQALFTYKVTNNTSVERELKMKPIDGAPQVLSGINACSNRFHLAKKGGFCYLKLFVDGNNLSGNFVGVPEVCADDSEFSCSKANPIYWMQITHNPIPPALTSVSISAVSNYMIPSATEQFTATGTYSDGSQRTIYFPAWTSTASNYVTMNSSGLATAISLGAAQITARYDNVSSQTFSVTVQSHVHGVADAGHCANCHNGSIATGKPGFHIPTSGSCDLCHTNFTSFNPASTAHGDNNPSCSTCHSGAYLSVNAQKKPTTHVPTSLQCSSCHSSLVTFATWTMNHTGITNNCVSCHNGTYAIPKPSNHIPTSSDCTACHSNFTAFAPAQMSHAGIASGCVTCHNGSYVNSGALAKPSNHIPTSSSCEQCHQNTVAFAPALMSHTGTAGQCSTCHSGAYVAQNAQTKPVTHVATSAQCDACHSSTTTWTLPLTSISISALSHTMTSGQSQQFTVTGTYAGGAQAPLSTATWVSLNPSVLSINSSSGSATANGTGTSDIIAISGGITSSPFTVTVS